MKIEATRGTTLTRPTSKAVGSEEALSVAIVDDSGAHVTSFGGGTQYADGAAAATPTGTQVNWNEAGTQRSASLAKPLPTQVVTVPADPFGANADAASMTGSISAKLRSLAATLSGPGSPVIDSYATVSVSLAANTADQQLVAAPGASKQIWVYGLLLVADTADGSISIQDSDDTAHTGVMPFAQKGGFGMSPSGNFSMPWIKVATNKGLEADTVTCGAKGSITYAIVSV